MGARGSYQSARFTSAHHVPYFVNKRKFETVFMAPGTTDRLNLDQLHNGVKIQKILNQLEENVEVAYLRAMQAECVEEKDRKVRAQNRAMGFWGPDKKLWEQAQKMTTPSCDIIREKFGEQYIR